MDPLTILSLAMTVGGGLKGLLEGQQDPYKDIRAQMERIISQIEGDFPQLAEAMKTREATQRGELVRRQQDIGAAGGLPRNVIAQNVGRTELGSQRNLGEELGNLNQLKMSTLSNLARLTGSLPPQPVDTSTQALLGTGLQGLQAFSQPGDWNWLLKLLGGGETESYDPNLGLKLNNLNF